jgi:hypothetical protein
MVKHGLDKPVTENFKDAWETFRQQGLLWLINRTLHLFGYAIRIKYDELGQVETVMPTRCKYRGFDIAVEQSNAFKLSKYLKDIAQELYAEARHALVDFDEDNELNTHEDETEDLSEFDDCEDDTISEMYGVSEIKDYSDACSYVESNAYVSYNRIPHKCPVCLGTGTVPSFPCDYGTCTDASQHVTMCRACGGTCVVWEPC